MESYFTAIESKLGGKTPKESYERLCRLLENGWRITKDKPPEKDGQYLAKWVDMTTEHTWIEYSMFYAEAVEEKYINLSCSHFSIDNHWYSHYENKFKKVVWWIEIPEPPEE